MIAERVRLLIATFWAGSLWTVGYIAAPTLFAVLPDRTMAGSVAGALFRIEAWLSVVCGLLLLGLLYAGRTLADARARKTLIWLVVAMLMCTFIGYFALQPFMAELRATAGPGGLMEGAMRNRFGLLHGVASLFYLLQSLLAVALIWKSR